MMVSSARRVDFRQSATTNTQDHRLSTVCKVFSQNAEMNFVWFSMITKSLNSCCPSLILWNLFFTGTQGDARISWLVLQTYTPTQADTHLSLHVKALRDSQCYKVLVYTVGALASLLGHVRNKHINHVSWLGPAISVSNETCKVDLGTSEHWHMTATVDYWNKHHKFSKIQAGVFELMFDPWNRVSTNPWK